MSVSTASKTRSRATRGAPQLRALWLSDRTRPKARHLRASRFRSEPAKRKIMDPRVFLASGRRSRASGRLEMPKAADVCVDKWTVLRPSACLRWRRCWSATPSRSAARGSSWLSPALVVSVLFTGFFKAPGRSAWSKPFGRWWPCAAGTRPGEPWLSIKGRSPICDHRTIATLARNTVNRERTPDESGTRD